MPRKGFDEEAMGRALFQDRPAESIKNDFGKATLLGSSTRYPLSVLIASSFAELASPGYLLLGVPEAVQGIVFSRAPLISIRADVKTEENTFLPPSDGTLFSEANSLLFGNGIEENEGNLRFLSDLVTGYGGNLLLDAGALNLLAKDPSLLERKNPASHILLTPHLGEAGRLLKQRPLSRDPKELLASAIAFAKAYQVSILLKSARSLLVTSQGEVLDPGDVPTPVLAHAGSGDALAGFLAGLLAAGTGPFSFDETVLFGDRLFHEVALDLEKAEGKARDVLALEPYLRKRISAFA